MILLDTNTCVAVLNRRIISVRTRLLKAAEAGELIMIPSVVAFELWFGAANSGRVQANTQALLYFLDDFDVLPFDGEDARIAGAIRFELKRTGRPIGTYDVLIAAQTLRHDAVLVTANVRELSRVPELRWENWEA